MCAPIPSRHTHAIKVNTARRRRVRITQNFIGLLLLSDLMVFFSSSRSAHFQAKRRRRRYRKQRWHLVTLRLSMPLSRNKRKKFVDNDRTNLLGGVFESWSGRICGNNQRRVPHRYRWKRRVKFHNHRIFRMLVVVATESATTESAAIVYRLNRRYVFCSYRIMFRYKPCRWFMHRWWIRSNAGLGRQSGDGYVFSFPW